MVPEMVPKMVPGDGVEGPFYKVVMVPGDGVEGPKGSSVR